MAWSTPPDFVAGTALTEGDLDILSANQAALGDAWTSFTPTWTASTTNPALGNGTAAGWYRQIGKTLDVRYRIAMGSTTTSGTGYWKLRLPNSLSITSGHTQVIQAFLKDFGTAYYRGIAAIGVDIDADYDDLAIIGNDSANAVTGTVPFTWTTNDVLVVQGTLQVA